MSGQTKLIRCPGLPDAPQPCRAQIVLPCRALCHYCAQKAKR
jgi:hypothetical protein